MAGVHRRGQQTVLPPLAEANPEPGGRTIYGVVSLLHAILRPLTHRDWRDQEKIPRPAAWSSSSTTSPTSTRWPSASSSPSPAAGRASWPRPRCSASRSSAASSAPAGRSRSPRQRRRGGRAGRRRRGRRGGRAVVVYPEGTITRDPDLWPMRGRTGAARVALADRRPVVPIGQWGARGRHVRRKDPPPAPAAAQDLPADRRRPGAARRPARGSRSTAAVLDEATERIMAAVTALVAELRGEPPPAVPFDPRSDRRRGSGVSDAAGGPGAGRRDGLRLLGHRLRAGRCPTPGTT